MREWKDERVNWKDEYMKGWKDERMKRWKGERMKGWKQNRMNGWMSMYCTFHCNVSQSLLITYICIIYLRNYIYMCVFTVHNYA